MATAIPDIGPLVSIVGALGFSLLGLIVPCIMETVWYWDPRDDKDDGDDETLWHSGGCDRPASGTHVGGTASPTNTGVRKNAVGHRRHLVCRVVRHLKNVALFLLGVFALIGGAYYNVLEMVALASEPVPSTA